MIQLRHTGIYVDDLDAMTAFYKESFEMAVIVKDHHQSDELICELLECKEAEIKIAKLITEQGQANGYDDMIELIKVRFPRNITIDASSPKIFYRGCVHIAFAVPNVDSTIKKIKLLGGCIITRIHTVNGKRCCFVKDIEGNYIEIIENVEA